MTISRSTCRGEKLYLCLKLNEKERVLLIRLGILRLAYVAALVAVTGCTKPAARTLICDRLYSILNWILVCDT